MAIRIHDDEGRDEPAATAKWAAIYELAKHEVPLVSVNLTQEEIDLIFTARVKGLGRTIAASGEGITLDLAYAMMSGLRDMASPGLVERLNRDHADFCRSLRET